MKRNNIMICSKYNFEFCENEKRIIDKMQAKHKEKTGSFLSIERAVKKILVEWNDAIPSSDHKAPEK